MLKTLKTRNFRKLVDREFNFTDGLNVIRGANEEGKSTLMEAVQYALFGVKACREGIADMVTWGQPESALEVNLAFQVEGTDYTIKRNKAGAELRYTGGHVTGQNEVGLFVARLFGVPLAAVSNLMLASQNDIRGTIEGGDTDSTKLIETLANLSALDNLLDLIKGRLATGVDVAAQSRLATAKVALDELNTQPVTTDIADLKLKAENALTRAANAKGDLLTNAAETEPLNHAYGVMIQNRDVCTNHNTKTTQLTQEILQTQNEVAATVVPTLPADEEVASAQAAVIAARDATAIAKIHAEALKLAAREFTDTYTGTVADCEADYAKCKADLTSATATVQTLAADVRVYQSQLVTGSACGYCAKDLRDIPEVAAKNTALNDKISVATLAIDSAKTIVADASAEAKIYAAILAADAAGALFVAGSRGYATLQNATVPRTVVWSGPVAAAASTIQADAAVVEINRRTQQHHTQSGRLSALTSVLNKKQEALAEHAGVLLPVVDQATMLEISAKIGALSTRAADLRGEIDEASIALEAAKTAVRDSEYLQSQLATKRIHLQEQIDGAQEEIKTLAFNNVLVKRVREVRPMVAAHLWTKILSAVSYYFTQMRGVSSVVTKSPTGFQVDGHGLKGMSGSTKDALGLAVRLALTKTFTPHVSLLFIDEPFAAMDTERTNASFGFIAGCGFKQTILITHEDSSTASANNLIEV